MTDSLDEKHERNREQRLAFVRRWADYVRTHPDAEWKRQVNRVVEAQLAARRRFEANRPAHLDDGDDEGDDGPDGADSIDHARRKNRNGDGNRSRNEDGDPRSSDD